MKNSDRLKRAIVFHFSVLLFLVTFPILLSYSLGYKIDFNALKIYKTGIIYINSHPSGASIYINGKLHKDLTPAQIGELKPAVYKVEVTRDGFYKWENDVKVRPNMVTKVDRIVLFPVTKEMKRIGGREVTNFAISDKNYIYYLAPSGLFRSNIDGSGIKKLSSYSDWPKGVIQKKFSPDGNELLYFDERHISVAHLNLDKDTVQDDESAKVEEVLTTPYPIIDVFWYSKSGYIVVVTEKDVKVVELQGGVMQNVVSLYKFNSKPRGVYYDDNGDSLYFTDTEKRADWHGGSYIYRLDLRQTFFGYLKNLIMRKDEKTGQGEQR